VPSILALVNDSPAEQRTPERRPLGKRLADWSQANPFLALLLFVALLVTSAFGIIGGAVQTVEWVGETFFWRHGEYEKLQRLQAGFTLSRFESELGSPTFARVRRRSARSGREERRLLTAGVSPVLRETVFRGRDYWVQAVSNADGSVLMWSVTSCDEEFRPTFKFPTLAGSAEVTLQESKLSAVYPREEGRDVRAHYLQGATGTALYYEQTYTGNPGNYQSFAWGWGDGCGDAQVAALYDRVGYPKLERGRYGGLVRDVNRSTARFRDRAAANSYAETAPGVAFDDLTPTFELGAPRILTRTVS
jgi:hypothetical protein